MSQGYIGYHLQNAIGNELTARGLRKDVATVVTQVLVDENDPAFQHPTKPIGSFYDKVAADRIMAQRGCTMVEDAGRGWRQVVPSPKPVDVIEKNTVRALVDNGTVVITVGGGGIPVVRRNGRLVGTPAVIDKDFASAKLAELLNADMLIILTAVEKVAINFGKHDQQWLSDLTPELARQYIAEGQFAPGSMLPKVQAALSFAESAPGRVALITLLEKAKDGIEGKTGTRVHLSIFPFPSLAPQGLLSLNGRPDSLIHGSRRSRQPVGVPTASRVRRVRESTYNTHRLPDRAGHLMCPALLVYPIPDSADPYHRSGFFSAHYKFSQKFSSFFVLVAVNL